MYNFIFEKIKRVQALAEIGREFSQNIFDRERYDELHEISLQMMNQITGVPVEKIVPVIQDKNGYKTPKVDV
ncbi:MAG: NUDIX hydrolase N-terminal domain-containing protein, partial [Bacteroidales bacterium]|nr:NUDIX hydrolase N-terminal domain-containing protein [Bacteroidales bacterium]